MYRLTDAMRPAVLPSLFPASRSNPLKEMMNRYRFNSQDLLEEVTEGVFREANNDVILEAFHTVKLSSLTPMPRKFINVVKHSLPWAAVCAKESRNGRQRIDYLMLLRQ